MNSTMLVRTLVAVAALALVLAGFATDQRWLAIVAVMIVIAYLAIVR